MKKSLKIIGLALLLILLVAIILPFIFKDQIIGKAKAEINKQIKGEVNFGEFDVTLFSSFPDFSLNIDQVSLKGAGPFEKDTLFKGESVSITLDLMSVIKGDEYQIKEIILTRPVIKAIVLHDSTANWDIALPSEEEPAAASSEPASYNLRLDKFSIIDGEVIYDDRAGNMYAHIKDLDHTSSGNFDEVNYELSTVTNIAELDYRMDGLNYLKKAVVEMNAELNMDMANSKYTFLENEIKLNALVLGLDGFVAMPDEAIDMDLKLNAKETEFKNILSLIPSVYMTDFDQVQTSGTLALDAIVKGRMEGEQMPAYNLNLIVNNGMFKYPDLPKSANNIQIDLNVDNPDGVDDHMVINVKKFHLDMAGNPFDARLLVKTPISDPQLDAQVKGVIVLSEIKDFMPLEPGEEMNGTIKADINAKGRMSAIENEKYEQFEMDGDLQINDFKYKTAEDPYEILIAESRMNFSPSHAELVSFKGNIGESDINASGRIDNLLNYFLKDDLLTGTFRMKSNKFNLNEFMSDETETAETSTATTEEEGVFEIPRNIDFRLTSEITNLLYENLTLKNVLADLHVKEGSVDINNLKADLLGGSIGMKGKYSTLNPVEPYMNLDLNVNGLDIQQTYKSFESLENMAPAARHARGKFSTSFKIAGSLDEAMNPIYSTLNGGGKLNTTEVLLTDFKVAQKIASTLKLSQFDPLNIQDLNPSFSFKDGRVFVDPVDIKIGNIKGVIGGSNGFDQTLDYIWKLVVPTGSLGTQAAGALNSLAGKAGLPGVKSTSELPVNIKIGGTVTDPKIDISMEQFTASIKEEITTQVEEKVEEVKEDVKAEARAQADKILKDAQVQADRIKAEAAAAAARAKKEGYAAADKLEAEAKNPLAKVAAKKAADKLRQETDEKAKNIENEGNRKADQIMQDARARSEKLLQ